MSFKVKMSYVDPIVPPYSTASYQLLYVQQYGQFIETTVGQSCRAALEHECMSA
jgi:hypothetical protein